MSFKVPNIYRIKEGPLGSEDSIGNVGAFKIPDSRHPDVTLWVIASDGLGDTGYGWEHVSVHGETKRGSFTPSWDQMCLVKDLFWDDEDCVIEYHPPKSQYINKHKNTLHLWRLSGKNSIALPPKILIG